MLMEPTKPTQHQHQHQHAESAITLSTHSISNTTVTLSQPDPPLNVDISPSALRKNSLPSPSGPRGIERHRHLQFLKLKAEWHKTGVDARCEALLDGIINDIFWGSYLLPEEYLEKYKFPKPAVIGSGANGRIFQAVRKEDGKGVALKVTLTMAGSLHEIAMLKYCALHSTKIVQLLDHFQDSNISIAVLELAGTPWNASNSLLSSSTHLNLRFRKLPFYNKRINVTDLYACLYSHSHLHPHVVRYLFAQMVGVVYDLHIGAGVSHGDLKLQNFLVDAEYGVKLVDMSAARWVKNGFCRSFLGTPMFGAPEALNGNFDGRANDVWALGVILHMLLYGLDLEPEFNNESNQHLVLPKLRYADEDAKHLLCRLLTKDPTRRPTITCIREHIYITSAPITYTVPSDLQPPIDVPHRPSGPIPSVKKMVQIKSPTPSLYYSDSRESSHRSLSSASEEEGGSVVEMSDEEVDEKMVIDEESDALKTDVGGFDEQKKREENKEVGELVVTDDDDEEWEDEDAIMKKKSLTGMFLKDGEGGLTGMIVRQTIGWLAQVKRW
ncbi:hypothetical protein HDV05_002821 [Chytridiales sp. JEL 0842]|nr:hypothetical protein HDV05_002821 [Chytridiales sp. JEL 0842]